MTSKKEILRKIEIVVTNHFNSPEAAFSFFDSNGDKSLSKEEIVKLLKQAEISGFIRGMVSSKLTEAYDKDRDGRVNWTEFKFAIDEIMNKS
ncbi:MAG: EF-hand domain-containing protein [Psychroserpens sp.]|uniref:EF-hand domain-containing protein n=1 Tax=Psychroserpens sp. TaxID=2020870 RepID=UPI003C747408